jgi:hypothetical protein
VLSVRSSKQRVKLLQQKGNLAAALSITSLYVVPENAAHFLDRLRMPLRRMWGANHNFGCHAVKMRALMYDHSVRLAVIMSLVESPRWLCPTMTIRRMEVITSTIQYATSLQQPVWSLTLWEASFSFYSWKLHLLLRNLVFYTKTVSHSANYP